ncbi:hypothetical protein LIER_23566 [Lithospermum erythrorhizon]|uniref:Uncharacterized protein n=1 Tax=Lithospermum erythrorhizon TaxID=34254 RepID=A0AAV3QZI4_LITER
MSYRKLWPQAELRKIDEEEAIDYMIEKPYYFLEWKPTLDVVDVHGNVRLVHEKDGEVEVVQEMEKEVEVQVVQEKEKNVEVEVVQESKKEVKVELVEKEVATEGDGVHGDNIWDFTLELFESDVKAAV